jgi:DNA repair protein RadA/Sms
VALGGSDVFVSVAGGVRVEEPGADLAVALALASAAKSTPFSLEGRPLAAYGEIGLTGELRAVAHPDRREAEARKFGLERVVAPSSALATLREAVKVARGGQTAPARAA